MTDRPRVFIGFDPRESVAWHVFNHSIQRKASVPVSVAPVSLAQLKDVLDRPKDPMQSNDFSFSRWLVPYLCDYKGWAIFADCDMLCRADISELWALRDPTYSVQVVKHDHVPSEGTKYLGNMQTQYAKKNWSSVVLFNNEACRNLTPHYVNHATGLELHQFKWLEGDEHIGEIPAGWNHLVGYDHPNPMAKIAHFTTGGPYFMDRDYYNCEFAAEWWREFNAMTHCKQVVETP